MRVVMINPRAQKAHRRLPLSLLFLARGIPADHAWEIFDANVQPDADAAALAAVAADPSNVAVLITVMPGPQLRWAVPFCRRLKARFPHVPVIWGGYFPTVYPAVCAQDPLVDVVVIGQGEATIGGVLEAVAGGASAAGLPGTAVWKDGALVKGPAAPLQTSASFGPAAYGRLSMETYAAQTFLGRRTFNHHSSVGCPYVCNFCAVTNMFNGRWLADRADEVISTVRHLHGAYGADAIEFHDNNFFAAEKRVRAVAEGISDLGLSWWGEGRVDTMLGWGEQTWLAMAKSGLRMVFFGAESGDEAALEAMDKGGLEVAHTEALNRRAMGHGIIPEFSFVLGNPENPDRDIDATLALIRRLKAANPLAEIILYVYTPVPLPGMYDEAQAQGFAFPDTLDGWVGSDWHRYEERRGAVAPWLSTAQVQRIYDFETVLHARWPSVSDRNLSRWQRRLLRALSAPRYRLGWTGRPVEIKVLQRVWHYRRPEEMGF